MKDGESRGFEGKEEKDLGLKLVEIRGQKAEHNAMAVEDNKLLMLGLANKVEGIQPLSYLRENLKFNPKSVRKVRISMPCFAFVCKCWDKPNEKSELS